MSCCRPAGALLRGGRPVEMCLCSPRPAADGVAVQCPCLPSPSLHPFQYTAQPQLTSTREQKLKTRHNGQQQPAATRNSPARSVSPYINVRRCRDNGAGILRTPEPATNRSPGHHSAAANEPHYRPAALSPVSEHLAAVSPRQDAPVLKRNN
ncbi:hypothetical protein E2C01_010465 [Portunus trituberculatus]|uniref:Uncharacterized protein n=1 Tax=Portunus trituberculatus TaxID=210409 RepID=A0A5B7D8R5_PORTR|nr:hypothetical protein [Portunus trituberculatus]